MGMKYVSAYLLSVMGGKDKPTAKDLEAILGAAGIECDSEMCAKLVGELADKDLCELLTKGRESLQGFGGGAGGAAAGGAAAGGDSGAAAGGAAAAAPVEEEEEEDMEFDLFDYFGSC